MTLKASVHYDGTGSKFGRVLKDLVKTVVPLYVSVVSGGNGADQTEDVMQTFSIPANTLGANLCQGIEIEAWGTFAANGDNKQVKLYFGASVIASGVVTANAKNWFAKMKVFRTGVATQVVVAEMLIDTTDITPTVTTGAETETAAIVAKVTGQETTASTANSITCKLFIVRSIEQKV